MLFNKELRASNNLLQLNFTSVPLAMVCIRYDNTVLTRVVADLRTRLKKGPTGQKTPIVQTIKVVNKLSDELPCCVGFGKQKHPC